MLLPPRLKIVLNCFKKIVLNFQSWETKLQNICMPLEDETSDNVNNEGETSTQTQEAKLRETPNMCFKTKGADPATEGRHNLSQTKISHTFKINDLLDTSNL